MSSNLESSDTEDVLSRKDTPLSLFVFETMIHLFFIDNEDAVVHSVISTSVAHDHWSALGTSTYIIPNTIADASSRSLSVTATAVGQSIEILLIFQYKAGNLTILRQNRTSTIESMESPAGKWTDISEHLYG